jgi:hypothetical protein
MHVVHTWKDPRLAYDKDDNTAVIIRGEENLNKLWLPDTYFDNARKLTVESQTVSLRLHGDGSIAYAYR